MSYENFYHVDVFAEKDLIGLALVLWKFYVHKRKLVKIFKKSHEEAKIFELICLLSK